MRSNSSTWRATRSSVFATDSARDMAAVSAEAGSPPLLASTPNMASTHLRRLKSTAVPSTRVATKERYPAVGWSDTLNVATPSPILSRASGCRPSASSKTACVSPAAGQSSSTGDLSSRRLKKRMASSGEPNVTAPSPRVTDGQSRPPPRVVPPRGRGARPPPRAPPRLEPVDDAPRDDPRTPRGVVDEDDGSLSAARVSTRARATRAADANAAAMLPTPPDVTHSFFVRQ